jgi:hypothetical protein
MKKRRLGLGIFLLLLVFLIFGVLFHEELARRWLESALNQNTQELFLGSLRLAEFRLEPKLRVRLGPLRGRIRAGSQEIPFEVQEIVSSGPLTDYFSREGLELRFAGFGVGDSPRSDIRGIARTRGGREGSFDLRVEIQNLGLEELARFDPENLKGAAGELEGEIAFRQDMGETFEFQALLRIEQPGGRLPSRFFEPLLAYLPEFAVRREVRKVVAARGLVDYREASLQIRSVQTDRVKIFFHILIPEYNLDLNVNLEVRADEKTAFADLASLLGLLKTEAV